MLMAGWRGGGGAGRNVSVCYAKSKKVSIHRPWWKGLESRGFTGPLAFVMLSTSDTRNMHTQIWLCMDMRPAARQSMKLLPLLPRQAKGPPSQTEGMSGGHRQWRLWRGLLSNAWAETKICFVRMNGFLSSHQVQEEIYRCRTGKATAG